jgi:acyl-CoA synthetase (AMP-forming)/AMP-acid ligase II
MRAGADLRLPTTIAGELAAAATDSPDRPSIWFEGRQLTFAELDGLVRTAARSLIAAGVRAGDPIAVWAPNTLDAAIALLAVPVAGAVAVPMNTRYRAREMQAIVERAGARLVLAPEYFLGREYAAEAAAACPAARVIALGAGSGGSSAWSGPAGYLDHDDELVARIAAQGADDLAVVQYTSGTTGLPKGAALRQGPMLGTARTWTRIVGLGPDDRYPITYPLAHVGGFKTGLLSTLVRRTRSVLFPVVDTDSIVDVLSTHHPTVLSGPPPVMRAVLDAAVSGRLPADLRIRTVVTGSAIVPPALVTDLRSVLGVTDVINGYGLTEATGVCAMTRRGDPAELVCTTVGRPIDGVEVRIAAADGAGSSGPAATGEIEIRGSNVMVGYLNDPAATDEVMDDGWLRTGDVGYLGADGYLRIAGRAKDMVVVGGFNVYPAEVEQVLAEHPAVLEAAAVGVPDERLGEVVVAFVVRQAAGGVSAAGGTGSGDCAALAEELAAYCRERLANYKVPRQFRMIAELPRGAVGKVAKAELRQLACGPAGAA